MQLVTLLIQTIIMDIATITIVTQVLIVLAQKKTQTVAVLLKEPAQHVTISIRAFTEGIVTITKLTFIRQAHARITKTDCG